MENTMDVIMVKLRSLMQRTSLNNALGMERSFPCVSVSCHVRSALCASHTFFFFVSAIYCDRQYITVSISPHRRSFDALSRSKKYISKNDGELAVRGGAVRELCVPCSAYRMRWT